MGMGKEEEEWRRVVLIPLPFQGHINPMLQLGSILHSKGFSITVVHTIFNPPISSNYPENVECPSRNAGEDGGTRPRKIACVIYDECMYFSEAVAQHVKLPSIVLRTTSASTYISRNAIVRFEAEGFLSSQGVGAGLHPLRFKDLPVSKIRTPEIFLRFITSINKARTSSSAVIWSTNDVLEQPSLQEIQKQCPVPIFAIGPLHGVAPASLVQLDRRGQELHYMAGQANSELGSVDEHEWNKLLSEGFIEAVGENGCIVEWAPQKEVLAHGAIGGYVSQVWRTGIQLENICDSGEVEKAIKRLMVDEEGKEMRQRAQNLKEKVEFSIRGGSAYSSLNELMELIRSF
ncbi:UDP-glucuronosyltransferase, putative isoform 2 [Hibiscus syriacus]|uniref:UDP-glucuronosyltransferase, putative isoform 2 n=1 Tax=Hibiscus syriacus TaxID=106335 RepID=A0A6A3C6Y0_HIBSY|nr:UDP-glucuronosyltransferase, putative isoform 2 [Hibiscus syriacus]